MAGFYRRLPLRRLYNARDLGGYPTRDGGTTRFGVFIRSDAPKNLTEGDLAFLKNYGVTDSIDFRGAREITAEPSCLRNVGWIRYLQSPTFNEQVAFATRGAGAGAPPVSAFVDWGAKYIEMADDCMGWVRETLEFCAAADGAVLYHCTTGKDRTGIISALLLGLADVPEEDIIADYCVSEVYLRAVYEGLRAAFLKRFPTEPVSLADPFFKTAPANMAALLAHLKDKYGGIGPYLAACGVKEVVCGQLRRRLTGV
ncbi:protein-tyrosine phosphatase [Sporobacter termitidis DSM 10068]|uniref:Protein-tyrosine phosphatase n=1 Tax=Sporobacter termitidis DSM 10068 TaxID=1123282 RepID=A0A1M5Z6D3_9FIRM|nr:tyrosine-protein phosphatase [Sporobacter termitidis]SHI19779.1 protein-tyrosine phosphatase [Sporobacter termitidis DSM 10068]